MVDAGKNQELFLRSRSGSLMCMHHDQRDFKKPPFHSYVADEITSRQHTHPPIIFLYQQQQRRWQTNHAPHLIVASRFWRALEIVEKWPASVLFSDAVFASQ